jgi:hypothetical protein
MSAAGVIFAHLQGEGRTQGDFARLTGSDDERQQDEPLA